MPCATVHLLLAERVLADWRTRPGAAPVAIDVPGVRDAFLHGALAPDLGFVAGTDRLISEVAHYIRPGDLVRDLVDSASTSLDAAFAWGWATHVLGDVQIHPIVGRAVGERLFEDRTRRVDALEDTGTHVSLEVGLDIALLRASPPGLQAPARPFLRDSADASHLAAALERIHALAWDRPQLVRDHRRAVQQIRWWPRLLAHLPLAPPGGSGRTSGGRVIGRPIARLGRTLTRPGSAEHGFFRPEAPREWFLREVRERIDVFAESFREWADRGMIEPRNPNLETGEPAGVGQGHPASDIAAERVAELRGRAVNGVSPG
jgi:hypothetical protein